MSNSSSAFVHVSGLAKSYSGVDVLKSIDLSINKGEFVTLLGPSGSGKSTILQILAGFTHGSNGSVLVDGQELLVKPPHKRNIGMVFQNYALFENMSVFDNVAYPLKLRGVTPADIKTRVNAALETVRLGEFGERGISQLSGGQKQRVALARAFVFGPQILLMDEPLSALDKNLREQMQIEIRALHEKLGLTTIFVTHDQREALTMSDRIAVLDGGRLQQFDTPTELYRSPKSKFVAEFIGETSFVPLAVGQDGQLKLGDQALKVAKPVSGLPQPLLVLRPEGLSFLGEGEAPGANDNILPATVRTAMFQGESVLFNLVTVDDHAFTMRLPTSSELLSNIPAAGAKMNVRLRAEDVVVVSGE